MSDPMDPHDESFEWLDEQQAELREWKAMPRNPGSELDMPIRHCEVMAELVVCEDYRVVGDDPLTDGATAYVKSDEFVHLEDHA